MGVISATTDDVLLDDVFVPEEDRLLRRGQGLPRRAGTPSSAGSASPRRPWACRSRLPVRLGYAAERTTFGKPMPSTRP